ncbi:MAG: ankyrin repeat domain-containing protein [Acidobacteriota bacterium]|nr:ankyrin repeat domain-containing protein [Acidobacteriota bacterium]
MKKNGFLDSIRVASPCTEDWSEMRGSEKVRFCEHCAHEVNNLSAMTRKEAMRLVKKSEGGICVRYVKNPETNAPVFAEKLYQITRRAGLAAAGVLGASLTLSTLAYAQGGTVPAPTEQTTVEKTGKKQSDRDKTESKTGTISGAVTDVGGAVIGGAQITLINQTTNESRSTSSSSSGEGLYEFNNVAAGTYRLESEAVNFRKQIRTNIAFDGQSETKIEVSLDASETIALMGVVAIAAEYEQPLLRAVSDENFEEVRDFIAKGANVNAKDKNYGEATALHVAVDGGNPEIVKYLLDMGAKINARDKQRRTPLMSIDYDATPELVRMLLDHRAKVNAADAEGNTALIFAAEYENDGVLRVLIDAGANVNAQNRKGKTALMAAAENDNYANVKTLLEAGADPRLRDADGETALDLTDDEKIRDLLKAQE